MKKTVFVLSLIVFLLLVGAGYADDYPVNPDLQLVREHDLLPRPLGKQDGYLQPNGSGIAGTITMTKAPTLGGTGTWTVSANWSYGTPTGMTVYLSMKDYSSNYTTTYKHEYDYIPSTVSSCKIVTAGDYEFSVFFKYANKDKNGYAGADYFTIRDDAAHTSLTEKVNAVVSLCRDTTKWKTALNLHEWLVHNVYYDPDYEYYGADMILRGYGVCDGYAKVYCMFCRAAGIPVYRVANDDHAWNAIRIGDEWYYVDCTWDDPQNTNDPITTKISGREHHRYFCVNKKLLALDHPSPWEWTGTSEKSCTSLTANYMVRTGEWKNWGPKYYWEDGICKLWSFSDDIAYWIKQGNIRFSLSADFYNRTYEENQYWWWNNNNGDIYGFHPDEYQLAVLVTGLNETGIEHDGIKDNVFDVSVSYWWNEYSNYSMGIGLNGWKIKETGTLKIPKSLKNVPKNSFRKNAATTLQIQFGCKTIGTGAFKNSAIRTVIIPNSVIEIAEDAFDGCGWIIFITKNKTAIQYAQDHGIIVIDD